ncbi:MAG: pyridoxal phosphate-dependent aminotransferase [Prevotellaceae bacterium]|nr:pyridoxal phosphate-dependent aminotransferase [Prevotellaceae bacterium]
MQKYDFDKVIDRRGTGAIKTDALQVRYGNDGLLPLWIADMDFETPEFITATLRQRMEHPIFGYTQIPAGYYQSIVQWLKEVQQWDVNPQWITYIPGIVTGIGLVLNVLTEQGDGVLIQPPVYHMFRLLIENNGRQVVNNPLKFINGRYEMDFDHLEQTLSKQPCKLLILCNPHNPGGMVWSHDTLAKLSEICERHHVTVVADEIHADMTLYGHRHTPYAAVSDAAARHSITFSAPSKTFNIAGLITSFAVTPDDTLRHRFYSWLHANELNSPNILSAIAAEAAYTHGHEWRLQLIQYLESNIDFIDRYISEHIPAIRVVKPEASFLVWLDCRKLGLPQSALIDLFEHKAGLALNNGAMFGEGGEGFMRINIGTPRSVLEIALKKLLNSLTYI